jgi:putative restriction endonuclease
MILNNYENKCAITGIDIPELLVASHIIPWADREDTRLDPENGICLSPLYDKAFDRGYIGVKKDYTIVLSSDLDKKIHKTYFQKYFQPLDGLSITLPYDHKPNKDYLEYHLDMIFEKHKSIV